MTTITGTGGNDSLTGGSVDDTLVGNGGADALDGGDGNDTIYAGAISPSWNSPWFDHPYTPPRLDTGSEVDTILGGAGNDVIFAGYGDNVDGGVGSDSLLLSFAGATSGVTAD